MWQHANEGFRVKGLGCRGKGEGCRVKGLGFRAKLGDSTSVVTTYRIQRNPLQPQT